MVDAWEAKERRGMRWTAWIAANISTLIANLFRSKGAKPIRFSVEDFLPTERRKQPQSTEHLKFVASALAKQGWGKMGTLNHNKN